MMKRLLVAGAVVAASGLRILAGDAGDAIFPLDLDNKARAELIYESYNRESDLDIGTNPTKEQKIDGDIYMLRMHTDVQKNASLDFDVGAIDPKGGDFGFIGGLGLRMLMMDAPSWRLSAMAQGHYAPSLSGEIGGVESDFDLWTADAALLLSLKLPIDQQLTVMPYAGPMLSIQRVDGESTTGSDEDISAEESEIFGGVVGVTLKMPGANTIRVEGRYFGEFDVSVGAGIAF